VLGLEKFMEITYLGLGLIRVIVMIMDVLFNLAELEGGWLWPVGFNMIPNFGYWNVNECDCNFFKKRLVWGSLFLMFPFVY
jgi:hypothetical protein